MALPPRARAGGQGFARARAVRRRFPRLTSVAFSCEGGIVGRHTPPRPVRAWGSPPQLSRPASRCLPSDNRARECAVGCSQTQRPQRGTPFPPASAQPQETHHHTRTHTRSTPTPAKPPHDTPAKRDVSFASHRGACSLVPCHAKPGPPRAAAARPSIMQVGVPQELNESERLPC